MKIKGEVWTNSKNWDENLMFTSNNGKYEGKVLGCPEYTAKLGITACEVIVIKKKNDDNFYYHSEDE
jgi:hypothetical protein